MKIQMGNKYRIIFYTCMFLFFFGCKTVKEQLSISEKNNSEIIQALIDNSIQFQTFSSKSDITFKTTKKSISSKASIKIIKDKQIQISFQPFFGVEAFKIDLSPDSVKIIDRINKQYAAERIDELSGISSLNFNFYNLQALLTNQLFLAGQAEIKPTDYSKFKIEKSKNKVLVHASDQQNIQYLFMCSQTARIQSLHISSFKNTNSLLSIYETFQSTNTSQSFPMSMNTTLKTASSENFQLNFLHSKIEINKNLSINSGIPDKYRRIRLTDVFSIIKGIL